MKKLVIGVLIIITLLVVWVVYEKMVDPVLAKNNPGEFVNQCNAINGKPFNYENISSVQGYFDLNGKHKITATQVEEYIKKQNYEYPLNI